MNSMDSMNRLKKLARRLDSFFGVLFWIILVGAALKFLVVVLILGTNNVLHHNLAVSINLGVVKITPSLKYLPQGLAAYAPVICSLIMFVARSIIICVGIRLLRNILKPIIQSTPFVGSVSKDLKKLGWFSLISGAVLSIGNAICDMVGFYAFNLSELVKSEKINQFMVSFHVDFTFVILAVILFLLSLIFRYGEELQQLSDETL